MATKTRVVPARYVMRTGEIVELEGYHVSSSGIVYRDIDGEMVVVPQNVDHADYMLVNICNPRLATNTGYRSLYVQRIVMSSFHADIWFSCAVSDHIDNNKHNNTLENLRWLHIAENTQRSRRIPIIIIDTIDGTETLCESITEAMQVTGKSYHHIRTRLDKKFRTERYIIRTAK